MVIYMMFITEMETEKDSAERLFNSEKCVGEEIIEIKKCK